MENISLISSWLGSGSINIFGRPFAGKDTQGEKLAELFGAHMLSSGEILRNSKDNQELQQALASGTIISSKLFESIVIPYLSKSDFSGKPLILSEVGRVLEEARIVLHAANDSGHPLKAVIALELSEEAVWQRFIEAMVAGDRGKRADDRREVLQTRLDKYRERVLPVIELYREKGLLIEIDGTLPRDEVTNKILESLLLLAKR